MFYPLKCKAIFPLLFTLSLILGCSVRHQQTQHLPQANIPPIYKPTTNNYWWRCQFKITWPEESKINWGMDLLLAHAVVSPILMENYRDISYWRFHRRAARDKAGHQFSFIFYTTPETAASVYNGIQQSSILQHAVMANLVEKVIIGDPKNPQSPHIEDTSDPHWSLDIQRNWPSFIMGVSALWLGIIDDSIQESPKESIDITLLLEKYRETDAKITETWRNEGQHAFLHHLSAVFGYNPMFVRKMLTF